MSTAFHEARYPRRPGYRGGETSRSSAQAMQPRLEPLQQQVLYAIQLTGGLAAWELPSFIQGVSFAALQPRLPELGAMKLIEMIDELPRINPATGRPGKVWRAR